MGAVQRKLSQIVRGRRYDRGAIDQTRQTRLPGHQHESRRGVDYWFQARSGDKPAIVYTPPQLVKARGRTDHAERNRRDQRRVRQIESQAGRRGNNGYLARWQSRRDQFNTLRGSELRGRFSESHRNAAVFLLAHILSRALKVDKADADEALWLFTEGLARLVADEPRRVRIDGPQREGLGGRPLSAAVIEHVLPVRRRRLGHHATGEGTVDVLASRVSVQGERIRRTAIVRRTASGGESPPATRERSGDHRPCDVEGLALPTLRELQELLLERAGIEATTATRNRTC